MKRAAQFFIPTEDLWEGLLSPSADGRSKEQESEYFRVGSPVKTKHMTVFLSGHQALGGISLMRTSPHQILRLRRVLFKKKKKRQARFYPRGLNPKAG